MENVVPSHLQRLRAADIIRMAGLATASVGQEYYRSGAVHSMSRRGALLAGIVEFPPTQGNDDTSSKMGQRRFPVEIEFVGSGQGTVETGSAQGTIPTTPAHHLHVSPPSWISKCSCRPDTQGQGPVEAGQGQGQVGQGQAQSLLCAHGAALLYQWLAQPSLFQTQDTSSAGGKEQGQGQPLQTPFQVQAKSEIGDVKSTRKNEGSDVTTGGGKEAVGMGMGTIPASTVPAFPTEKQMEPPIRRYSVGLIGQAQGAVPTENLQSLLSQLGLSELRATAREYNLTVSGTSRQQLAESIQAQMKKPEVVRRVATTLEKSHRQLLAALILAGGVMSDDDLRGLFERFSLGQPGQLQHLLPILQGKALLFRISLNASNIAQRPYHGLLNSALFDVGWYVPLEVRNALRVSVPIAPFDVTNVDEQSALVGQSIHVGQAHMLQPLSLLLLVARLLDGYTPSAHETWYERDEQRRSPEAGRGGRDSALRQSNSSATHAPDLSSSDGSVAMPFPEDLPPSSLLQELQERLLSKEGAGSLSPLRSESHPAFLRFIIRVLGVADLCQKGNEQSPALYLRPGTAERLLGTDWTETLRTLFDLWLTQTSYGDLYDLNEAGIRLRCRTYGGQSIHMGQEHHMGQANMLKSMVRSSELEAENSQARQYIVALLAQAPLNQWINFSAFARFVYRLNPLFLQRRQQWGKTTTGNAAPQWWLELGEGRPLRPLQLSDWVHAEFFYLRNMIAGPLHWWGVCDIVTRTGVVGTRTGTSPVPTVPVGDLLAFRLTPLAGWLFNDSPWQGHVGTGLVPVRPTLPLQVEEDLQEGDDYQQYVASLEVTDDSEILISCSVENWPVIQLLERFTEVAGIQRGLLAYRISAKAFGLALGRGLRPFVLLRLLRLAAETKAVSNTKQAQLFTQIAAQLERWFEGYSRVRLYTGVTLLETVDAAVMREVVTTTSLEEAVVQNIHPTLCIVKPNKIGHIVDELKQRGQSPLLHDEDL